MRDRRSQTLVAASTRCSRFINSIGLDNVDHRDRYLKWYFDGIATRLPASPRCINRRIRPPQASTVRNAIVNNATTNRLMGIGSGSPNRLFYLLFF
jgi:hypothetical protein